MGGRGRLEPAGRGGWIGIDWALPAWGRCGARVSGCGG